MVSRHLRGFVNESPSTLSITTLGKASSKKYILRLKVDKTILLLITACHQENVLIGLLLYCTRLMSAIVSNFLSFLGVAVEPEV